MWEVSASLEPGSTDPRSARRWPVSGNPRRGSGGPPYRRTRHSGRKVASPGCQAEADDGVAEVAMERRSENQSPRRDDLHFLPQEADRHT